MEIWLTFHKIKFGEFFAANYLATLRAKKLVQYKTPFGSLKILEIKNKKIILSGSIKDENKNTIPVIISFDKETKKFRIIEKYDQNIFEIGIIQKFLSDDTKKTAIITTFQNASGDKEKII